MAGENYRRIVPGFWTDPDVRPLTLEEKAILLYYFTSPHSNMIGLFYCPVAYIAAETFRDAGEQAIARIRQTEAGPAKSFLTRDPGTDEVWVHAAAKHNLGDHLNPGDHRIAGVQRLLAGVHSPQLHRAFFDRYGLPFRLGPWKPLGRGYPSPSEGVDAASRVAVAVTDTVADTGTPPPTSSPELGVVVASRPNGAKGGKLVHARSLEAIKDRLAEVLAQVALEGEHRLKLAELRQFNVELVFAYWASKTGRKGVLLDPKRERTLTARLQEGGDNVSELLYVVDGALKDPHLQGQNDRNRKYDGVETVYQDRAHVERLARLGGYRDEKVHPMAAKYAAAAAEGVN